MGEEREEVTKVEKSWIWERRDWRRSRVVGWRRMRSRATGVGAVKEEKKRRGKWEKQSKRTRKEKRTFGRLVLVPSVPSSFEKSGS